MTPRAFLLVAAIALTTAGSLWVPWKIRVRQKGDDRYLSWRYAWIFNEGRFDSFAMAQHATEKLHIAISPSDVEPLLDHSRVYLELTSITLVAAFGWLLLGERNRA